MKKFLAALLILCFFCGALAACGGQEQKRQEEPVQTSEVTAEQMEEQAGVPVVTVLLDTHLRPWRYSQLSKALEGLPGCGRDFLVNIDMFPYEGAERDMKVTQLRTEILAGRGPDLFLCGSNRLGAWGGGFASEPFFRFPEQAMDHHIFLPLDDCIANAEYMEWDALLPQVMEAGKNEEGQLLLPMAYYLSLTFFDKNVYTPALSPPCSWDDMIHCQDPAILCAANDDFSNLLGCVADYAADAPLLSEEELLSRAKDYLSLLEQMDESMKNAPEHFSGVMNRTALQWQSETLELGDGSPEYHMIPAYNVQGGVTVKVSLFAAINRNARHPEKAFQIADYLLSKKIQQNSSFYRELFEGMPVYQDLGSKDAPLDNGWYMSDANFLEYQNVLRQINQVKFTGPLDIALADIKAIPGATSEKELEQSVHEQYVLMQMLLAES